MQIEMEQYKPIKFKDNDRLRFIKNGSTNRECSFCGKKIQHNETILTINYQCWLHLKCIDPCCEEMSKFKREKIKELIAEKLSEK